MQLITAEKLKFNDLPLKMLTQKDGKKVFLAPGVAGDSAAMWTHFTGANLHNRIAVDDLLAPPPVEGEQRALKHHSPAVFVHTCSIAVPTGPCCCRSHPITWGGG